MSNYRSTRYAKMAQAIRREGIAAYYRHKAATELIPENENVFVPPKREPDVKVTIKFRGEPSMSFTSTLAPWGGWLVSPTLAGKRLQQEMIAFGETAKG